MVSIMQLWRRIDDLITRGIVAINCPKCYRFRFEPAHWLECRERRAPQPKEQQ